MKRVSEKKNSSFNICPRIEELTLFSDLRRDVKIIKSNDNVVTMCATCFYAYWVVY